MASPAFSINGGSVGTKASVAAGATVTATLASTVGVRTVEWSVVRTDDTSATTDYVLTPSGPTDSICSTTALTAGTAAVLQCRINSGIDPATNRYSAAMTTTVKFYVETTPGYEVLCAGELEDNNREASSTHGAVEPLNGAIRAVGSGDSLSYTVSTLPAATTAGQMIYVTDETGGAVPAFADGTNWRRVTDRAVVS